MARYDIIEYGTGGYGTARCCAVWCGAVRGFAVRDVGFGG